MMMSREASRLADDFGTLVPNANRHRPFTFDGQALGAGAGPPALAARSGRVRLRDAFALTSLPCQPRPAV